MDGPRPGAARADERLGRWSGLTVGCGVPMGAENEWIDWHHVGVGPPHVRLSAGGRGPRNGKVLRKTGVAEHWVRPEGAVVTHLKAWGKVLRT